MKSVKLFICTVISLINFSCAHNASKFSEWNIKVLGHNAYGYLENIGIPEAERVYKEEDFQLMPRIVGGDVADIVHHKYQAGLIISIANLTGFGICGGSLISANRVVTAAHCWFDGLHHGTCMTVVLGSAEVFSGGTRIKSSEVYTHPGWDPVKAVNDIAVVYLQSPVTFSDTIASIALPSKSEIHDDFVGETVVASGFGKTGESIPIPDDQVLSKVNLTVISNEECSLTYPQIICPSLICTSGKDNSGPVGVCNGDSGGPLVLNRNGKRILIGVSSFGSLLGCDASLPDAYSRVSSYLEFLKKHMKVK